MVKDRVFTVNLHHDGAFVPSPLRYLEGDEKQITDIEFEGMSFTDLREVIKHYVHGLVYRLYYCPLRTPLNVGIKEIKIDNDVQEFLRVGYNNKWYIDLYVEHFDYDVMDFINEEANGILSSGSSDEYYSSDECEEFFDVDFHNEGEDNVVIKNLTTKDPFLNKMCPNSDMYVDYHDHSVPQAECEALDDPEADNIDLVFQVKKGVSYPKYDPKTPWNKMTPVLGMRNVEDGRSAGRYTNKKRKIQKSLFNDGEASTSKSKSPKKTNKSAKSPKTTKKYKKLPKKNISSSQSITFRLRKRGEGCSTDGEGTSSPVVNPNTNSPKPPETPRATRKRLRDDKNRLPVCGFRLWASWMSTEHSFQIKTLKPDHKCSRNYNLGSLDSAKGPSKGHCLTMRELAVNLEDNITPSVRKKLEYYSRESRHWDVLASTYDVLEVRSGAQAFAINLTNHTCSCRLWQLSGVPCIHAVAAYMHVSRDADEGVSHWYSQEMWANAYQFSIRPVLGSLFWIRTNNDPPLPPIVRKMPGRPRKARVKAPDENNSQVSRRGKQMRCSNCQTVGHNKTTCDKPTVPKPPIVRKPVGRKREPQLIPASARVRGRGNRGGGGRGQGSGGNGQETGGRGTGGGGKGQGIGGRGSRGCGRGTRGGGRGSRGGGRGSRGGGRGSAQRTMDEEDIRQAMEHEYLQGLLDEQEEKMQNYEREETERLGEEALQQALEEERIFPERFPEDDPDIIEYRAMKASIKFVHPTQESQVQPKSAIQESDPNTASVVEASHIDGLPQQVSGVHDSDLQAEGSSAGNKKATRQKKAAVSQENRIYYKQRGRSERIKMMQGKKFKFDAQGSGSTPDKAFDVSPDATP
ncbi:hypothetical protein CTI12_AA561450 [Artemisia annua]|uniref:SWIM-type domain-containing protein n=1 Tax=Artemisia annua TaxID=35608 RepID=A0A2U1KWC4_ARTAN|nr:hypothetical protein CTI12_AA561450 [Artemisia annua]